MEDLLMRPIHAPTLGLTGAQDGCILTELFDDAFRAEHFPKGFQMLRLEKAGHFLQHEAPFTVSNLLLAWFKQQDTQDLLARVKTLA